MKTTRFVTSYHNGSHFIIDTLDHQIVDSTHGSARAVQIADRAEANAAYAARVLVYEGQGMTTSDAQGVCDAEDLQAKTERPPV